MVYYGWVKESEKPDPMYVVLRKALALTPSEAPFRGPKELCDGEFIYQNTWIGNIERYTGTEKIVKNGVVVYEASYLGGLVDQRSGV